MTTTTFTIHHDGVTVPVSRAGRGRPLVLCPGLSSTQADLHELTELLRRDHDVVTFDLRGHGLASPADRYSFDGFLGDLAAVMAELGRLDLPSAPVLVGYSLGADLAVHYASEHPGSVDELVALWRAGVERLVRERPHVSASWLDADHRLVFTHAPEIARIIRNSLGAARC